MAQQIFIETFTELLNDSITSKLLNGQLSSVLEKNVTKLFQNRKLIEKLRTSNFQTQAPLGRGGLGTVYPFGGDLALKETKICFRDIQSPLQQNLCDIEKNRKTVSPSRAVKWAKILGYSEELFVKMALDEFLMNEGIKKYSVEIKLKKAA